MVWVVCGWFRVLWLTFCTLSQGLGISCNACFYLQFLAKCLNNGALLDLPSFESESWRRYTLQMFCWYVKEKLGS